MWCAKNLFGYAVFDEINSGLVVCIWLSFNKKLTLEGGVKGFLKCSGFLCSTSAPELVLGVFGIKPP